MPGSQGETLVRPAQRGLWACHVGLGCSSWFPWLQAPLTPLLLMGSRHRILWEAGWEAAQRLPDFRVLHPGKPRAAAGEDRLSGGGGTSFWTVNWGKYLVHLTGISYSEGVWVENAWEENSQSEAIAKSSACPVWPLEGSSVLRSPGLSAHRAPRRLPPCWHQGHWNWAAPCLRAAALLLGRCLPSRAALAWRPCPSTPTVCGAGGSHQCCRLPCGDVDQLGAGGSLQASCSSGARCSVCPCTCVC